jgi:uncharacterized membrane protein
MESTPVPMPSQTKSQKVKAIGILMIISGIINLFWGAGLGAGLAFTICCAPWGLLPIVLGIFELVYGIRLMGFDTKRAPFATVQVVAVLEIVAILAGNIFSLVIGIINLVLLNEPEVRQSFS